VNYILLIVAIVLGALRIGGHTSEAYQAVAHLFVGGLFAAGYVKYQYTWTNGGQIAMNKIWLGVALSVLEVACALWFKFGGGA
jgi:hypothetical protein